MKPTLDWLRDVKIFQVNRLAAHSDHVACAARREAAEGITTRRQSLNGVWKLAYSADHNERPVGFEAPSFDTAAWDEIEVPAHVQMWGFEQNRYTNIIYPWDGHDELVPPAIPNKIPVACYALDFVPDVAGGRARISFQGAEAAIYVWLNGEFIGFSEDSMTPSEFDISGKLVDGVNRLAVECYKYTTGSWLEDQDFFRFFGIHRDVFVEFLPELHVEDIAVSTDVAADGSSAELAATFAFSGSSIPHTLNARLLSPCGEVVGVASTEGDSIRITVQNPELWSAEVPTLYYLDLELVAGGETQEYIRQTIGFRTVSFRKNILHINGKRVVFKGVNRHDFDCFKGRALGYAERFRDAATMKRNNINAVRTSHYPNGTDWYHIADELGLFLIDEANVETHGTWGFPTAGPYGTPVDTVVPGSKMEWLGAVIDRANSMYQRDKNHPSVVIWSLGNESYNGEVLFQMSEWFRRTDPSRPVHYEGACWLPGWEKTSDIYTRMYASPESIVEYMENDPQKPYILCEYMHAMGNSVGGMKEYTDLADKYPMYQGGFIWDYIDQALWVENSRGEPRLGYGGDFGDRPNDGDFSGDGIVFADGSPTPKMQEVKFLYQNIRLICDEKGILVQNKSMFKSTADYVLRWTLARNGVVIAEGSALPVVAAGAEEYIPLTLPSSDGELALTASMRLRFDTIWAEEGHEVALGQYVWGEWNERTQSDEVPLVVRGSASNGYKYSDTSVILMLQHGLASLEKGGKELMVTAPRPCFWRAETANDRGWQMHYRSAFWWTATTCAVIQQDTDGIKYDPATGAISYKFKLDLSGEHCAKLSYAPLTGGKVKVTLEWDGAEGLADLPNFGVRFILPASFDGFRFYGMGPEENYIDRNNGAKLGIYDADVFDNFTRYLKPQECGNRTGVRYAEVYDTAGNGMRIEMTDTPFELSVLPWTAEQVEQARHFDEMPEPEHTVVVVSLRQQGVAGQDSWGSLPYVPYRTPANQPLKLEFTVQAV